MEKDRHVKKVEASIELKEGVLASVQQGLLTLKGPKGENKRSFFDKSVSLSLKGNMLVLSAISGNGSREKMKIGSFKAHIKNMIKGVTEGFNYRLRICSGHFPITVSISSANELSVQNFLGEKIPRKMKILPGAKVKIDGQEITVDGVDIEVVSHTAASIEQLTRISNRDRRVFQDGCYIIAKDGKEIN